MFKKSFSLALFILMNILNAQEHLNFDKQWKFIQEDITGAEKVTYKDTAWRTLNLPHDWSIEGEYNENNPMGDKCGYLAGGYGWYRKTIEVPKDWKGNYVEIDFEGIFMNSTVWANGIKLGNRPYGWVSFAYDISQIVANSDTITFAVRVDNDKQPSARWYTGSGIYSHTWIHVKNKVHVARNGVFVTTSKNKVNITTTVNNTNSTEGKYELVTTIIDAEGNKVGTKNQKLKLGVNSNKVVTQKIEINTPQLWSVQTPYLYTLVSEVFEEGKTIHKKETRFGVRDVEWKSETGVWINGENVKLQGICNHQDAGALGAAVPDKILKFRIQQLKDMGVNAIRTAHNPQTPLFYDLCDEMGMIVMDEIFDGWERKAYQDYGARFFNEWWKKDVTDWVKRDRNHPSIIIYSVGNETKGAIGEDLVARVHELDPTRPVTTGHSESQFMDVFGVNGHSEKGGFFEHLKEESEGRVFIGTENTHTWQVRGYYRTKTWFRDGYPNKKQRPYPLPDLTEKEVFTHDWVDEINRVNSKQIFNSSYDNATVRVSSRLNIEQLRDIPAYAGSFRWTGHDYIGEAGFVHGGWPFKAFMGGAIDMANFEKDLYYLYQSQWTTKPMVHILPHWTHPKVAQGTEIPVWVYSNCDTVELFFDEVSLGKIKPGKAWDKMQCQWLVKWKPGTLKAVGYKNGKAIITETVSSADKPSNIKLSIDGTPLANQANDIVQVRVTTTDSKGTFYPYGENRTYFHVIGSGKIKALDNGSPVDVEQHVGPKHRKAFYGLTRAYIESNDDKGAIALLASSILGEKRQITSNKVSIDTQIMALRGKTPKTEIKVFYTTDGSTPTVASQPYVGEFEIQPETTVKALVVFNGQSVQILEEKFSPKLGFAWNKNTGKKVITGEQAENATITGGKVVNKGKNYYGKGYVRFEKKIGASIEWYQENDGGEGVADLYIRYAGKIDGAPGTYVKVFVNGKVIHEKFFLRNTRGYINHWNKAKLEIPLNRGANTIKIETLEKTGIAIDEILIN